LESALPENSDWISCSGCENSRSSGKKPNFDPKPRKTRNDSSYQSSTFGGKEFPLIFWNQLTFPYIINVREELTEEEFYRCFCSRRRRASGRLPDEQG
jgi:hypothetical protein